MPRVSIGLPVYNGARYLRAAIESVLQQTYDDFELVISDNASTDGTSGICEHYARCDRRIRYYRSTSNTGAADNFNRVLGLATSEYFKWAAHDDVCHPEFIACCVQALEENRSAVLAYPCTEIIDGDGNYVEQYEVKLHTDSAACHERFRALMRGHQCYEVFGVFRLAALTAAAPLGSHFGADAVLLARLGLMGRFIEIPRFLFQRRAHDATSETLRANLRQYATWWSTEKSNGVGFPYWRVGLEFARAVHGAAIRPSAKIRCYVSVGGWFRRRLRHLGKDLVAAARQLVVGSVQKERARRTRNP